MELSLWLADSKGGPVVALSLQATIGSVRKSESKLKVNWLHFHDSDEVVIVAELFDGWKVFVLPFVVLEWQIKV